jgi:hypothetical protein
MFSAHMDWNFLTQIKKKSKGRTLRRPRRALGWALPWAAERPALQSAKGVVLDLRGEAGRF